jgi:carbon monoxide dehydrogenase subunit G
MHYEGTIEAPVPKEEFYAFVTDPARVIGILPDITESKIADQDHFSVKARAGVAYLRGALDIAFEVVEKKKDSMATIAGHGQGMQSSVEIKLKIALGDSTTGTTASWAADVAVGGLLASVAGRLIDGVAAKYVKQITENLRQKVAQ